MNDKKHELLKERKILFLPLPAYQQANNANFLFVTAQLYTLAGEVIPDLLYHFEFKTSARSCNEKYTLQYLAGGDRRLFQLEVYHHHYPSHTEPNGEKWLGPHLYYNGKSRRTTGGFDCRESHRLEWFRRFCRHANIITQEQEGEYQRPLL